MKPIELEQLQAPVQAMLALLSDEKSSTPNNLLEGIVSGKSLLRAILQGHVVVCPVEEESKVEGRVEGRAEAGVVAE